MDSSQCAKWLIARRLSNSATLTYKWVISLVRLPPVVYLNFLLMHSVRRIANNAIGRQDKNKPHKPIILRPKIRFLRTKMTPPIGKGKKDIELLVMLVSWQCYSLMIWKGIGSVIIYKNKNVLYIHG